MCPLLVALVSLLPVLMNAGVGRGAGCWGESVPALGMVVPRGNLKRGLIVPWIYFSAEVSVRR